MKVTYLVLGILFSSSGNELFLFGPVDNATDSGYNKNSEINSDGINPDCDKE